MKTSVLSRFLLLLALFAGSVKSFAQDNTLQPEQSTDPVTSDVTNKAHNRILLIPFDPKLYMSAIDQNIATKTGLTHHQIKMRMRHGLNLNMFGSSDPVMKTISMLDSEDPEVQKDIAYIYNSIGYKYELMPEDAVAEEAAPEKGVAKLTGKLTRFVEQERETRDLAVNEDVPEPEPERYMKTTIINPNLLTYLSKRYEADVFLFINQLDITAEVDEGGYSYAKQKTKRRMKIHYTIYDIKGKEIHGGASIVYFPSNVNDLNGIIKDYMPAGTATIASHLPKKEPTNTQTATSVDGTKREDIEKY